MKSWSVALAAATAIWGGVILSGARVLLDYDNSPGPSASAPSFWPADSSIVHSTGQFTLVMLAHPDCPCTRASLVELEQLMIRLRGNCGAAPCAALGGPHHVDAAQRMAPRQLALGLHGKLDAFVLFAKPGADRTQVQSSGLWKKAAKIPGVSVLFDDSSREARRFGATVSGQTLLYDPIGRLAFRGGITRARGHEGYSPGEAAIVRIVAGRAPDLAVSPVFGCSLRDPDEEELEGDKTWKKR